MEVIVRFAHREAWRATAHTRQESLQRPLHLHSFNQMHQLRGDIRWRLASHGIYIVHPTRNVAPNAESPTGGS